MTEETRRPPLLYLDYNCFQRGFDDTRQVRIQMEALACQEIFDWAAIQRVQLAWSFMHQDETLLCPSSTRRQEALRLSELCAVPVGPKESIRQTALSFQQKGKLSSKDALHVACAVSCDAVAFITCDDRLTQQARRLKLEIVIANPVDYVRKEVK